MGRKSWQINHRIWQRWFVNWATEFKPYPSDRFTFILKTKHLLFLEESFLFSQLPFFTSSLFGFSHGSNTTQPVHCVIKWFGFFFPLPFHPVDLEDCSQVHIFTRLGLMNKTSSGTALWECVCTLLLSRWLTSARPDIHQRAFGWNLKWDTSSRQGNR